MSIFWTTGTQMICELVRAPHSLPYLVMMVMVVFARGSEAFGSGVAMTKAIVDDDVDDG
jgi:hypothetical protein